MDAIVRHPGEGEALDVGPAHTLLKATADTTGGLFTLSESTLPSGSPGPPLHTHERMHDNYYVLEGTLTLHVRDETVEATAGTFGSFPPGVAHTFSNPSDAPVRFLNLNAPGGFDVYLRELAAALSADEPPDAAAMTKLFAEHDVHPV